LSRAEDSSHRRQFASAAQGPRRDQHGVLKVLELVDLQVTQMREEQMEAAGFLACQGMLHNDPRGRSLMISSWSNKIFTERPHPWAGRYGIATPTFLAEQ
jgi:hypothetical protein